MIHRRGRRAACESSRRATSLPGGGYSESGAISFDSFRRVLLQRFPFMVVRPSALNAPTSWRC